MDTSVGQRAVYFSAYGGRGWWGGGGGLYYRSPFNTPITAVDYDPNTLKKKEKKKGGGGGVKRMLFITTKHNMQIFEASPFFKLKQQLNGEPVRDVGHLSAFGSAVLLCCCFLQ